MRFFVGLIIVAVAALVVAKTEWLVSNFGYSEFAENKLRMFGGTRLLIKFIGVVFILAGIFYMTGLHEGILRWFAGLFNPSVTPY